MILMYIMAFGILFGGIDRIFGNKYGYGEKLEEGLRLMGPTALSMVGIICLSKVLAGAMSRVVVPIFGMIGVDPSMCAGIFSMDMGGYQIAKTLAADPLIGCYAGIIVAATFGCTLVFTIPIGISIIDSADNQIFARGIIIGLATMPAALIIGGVACRLPFWEIIHQIIPILIFSFLLIIGLLKCQDVMMRGFQIFVKIIQTILTIGLMLGAISYITGFHIKDVVSIESAMKVVASICIMLMGSLPITELVQRLLKKPFQVLGKRLGMDSQSMTGLLVGCITPVPALMMLKSMNKKGKIVNIAFLVSAASVFGAHMGFITSNKPDFLEPMIIAKMSGGITAVIAALLIERMCAKPVSNKK